MWATTFNVCALCIYFVEPHTVTWFQHKYFLLPVWVSPAYSLAFFLFRTRNETKKKTLKCIRVARVISSFHFFIFWKKLLQKRKRCNRTVLMGCWIVDVQALQRTLSKTTKNNNWMKHSKDNHFLQQNFWSVFFRSSLRFACKILSDCDKRDSKLNWKW